MPGLAFEGNDRLMEVEAHSRNLSVLAAMGLEALKEPATLHETEALQPEFFRVASEPQGAPPWRWSRLFKSCWHLQQRIEYL